MKIELNKNLNIIIDKNQSKKQIFYCLHELIQVNFGVK